MIWHELSADFLKVVAGEGFDRLSGNGWLRSRSLARDAGSFPRLGRPSGAAAFHGVQKEAGRIDQTPLQFARNRVPLHQAIVPSSELSEGSKARRVRRWQLPEEPIEKPARSIVAMGALKLWSIFLMAGSSPRCRFACSWSTEHARSALHHLLLLSGAQDRRPLLGASGRSGAAHAISKKLVAHRSFFLFAIFSKREVRQSPLRTLRGVRLLESHLGICCGCMITAVAPWRREVPDNVLAQKALLTVREWVQLEQALRSFQGFR